ncbi:MAG: phosphopantothenoylcysteine decarboxylase [Planctomycetes bacterium]|nr:phosphopantothenoylcysteine decarboxylase [Planctomycetota bacterium]
MRILVTAGPTVEDIDDVRFISNRSSGKLGYAVAGKFAELGHEVTLVSGPVCLAPPGGVERVPVRSAEEMGEAVLERLADADVVVMAAAVADFRPAERRSGKIKKSDAGMVLELVKNMDILEEIGKRRSPDQTVAGFCLEAGGPDDPAARKAAMGKVAAKNLDAIVLNGPGNIGADSGRLVVLGSDGEELAAAEGPKEEMAEAIVKAVTGLHRERRRRR